MSMASSIFPTSQGTSGLRNRLAKFKAPDVGVMHDAKDEAEEEDAEILMQSFTSASSGASSEDSDAKLKKGMSDGEDSKEDGNVAVDDEPRGHSPHRQFSKRSNTIGLSPMQRPRTRRGSSVYIRQEQSTSSSGWFGLDLSIIVALVSPLGNLLTGGDHIKNVLLLLLLVYYLHQLVEVPWSLYRMSLTDPSASDSLQRNEAHAELRNLEILYLALTVLSPFIGATLLRVVATSITGDPETLSWFSTGLFVLATGLRPWSHLVQRLKDRSHALQELVAQYAAEEEEELERQEITSSPVTGEFQQEIDGLHNQIGALDMRVSELSKKNHHEWTDLAEHVTEVVDSVEDALRRHRTAITRANQTNEARFSELEARFEAIDTALADRANANGVLVVKGQNRSPPYLRGEQLKNLIWEVLAFPWTIAAICWMYFDLAVQHITHGHPSLKSEGKRRDITAPTPLTRHRAALEPIPEEDGTSLAQAESDKTLVSEPVEPVPNRIILSFLKFFLSPVTIALRITVLILSFPQAILRNVFG